MSICFQSLRSSSGGNCLMLWTERTRLLLDCGIKTQIGCRELFARHAPKVDAVIVSHAHSDHICYSSLQVLRQSGTPVHCHQQIVRQIHGKHLKNGDCATGIESFSDRAFEAGDFEVHPVGLPHAPGYPTFGFVIYAGSGKGRRKMVVCTDFNDYRPVLPHMEEADFVFIEANHDLELLRKFWNPSSLYHLSNPKTAEALCQASGGGRFAPRRVMLGHLSKQRNTAALALAAVRDRFDREGVKMEFSLSVAPYEEPSEVVGLD